MGCGKKRTVAQIYGDKGVDIFRSLLPPEWVLREYTPDYGIDASVEIFNPHNDGYITAGEHIYFQIKATSNIDIGKHKIYERTNVEKEYKKAKLYSETDVVKFSIDTSLLATVEKMGSSVPVLLVVIDLNDNSAYYICLNDYIEKIIVPENENYTSQHTITIYLPTANKIRNVDDVWAIRWYAKRPKLFSLFSKANYQKGELRYIDMGSHPERIRHFINILMRSDAWSACEHFYALKAVKEDMDFYLQNGVPPIADKVIAAAIARGEDVDEQIWESNSSVGLVSFREAQCNEGLYLLWEQLCNCGDILEDFAKEWLLPTFVGEITR